MLLNVHVKNFALIDEADINFGEGLNIITGETGAGKSILIDSVNAALGAKIPRHVIRTGEDSALVQLTFCIEDKKTLALLKEMDVPVDEEGYMIVSRRIMDGRSVCKINDETVTAGKVKKAASLLIDMHGQHEHQSLLIESRHLDILDEYAHKELAPLKRELKQVYQNYVEEKKILADFSLNEEERIRQIDFLNFEINEIEEANIKQGEEEELSNRYKKLTHAKKIGEALAIVLATVENDRHGSAADQITEGIRQMLSVSEYDEKLSAIVSQLNDVESILSDLHRDIIDVSQEMELNQEEFHHIEGRLGQIHSIQIKHGKNFEKIMETLKKKQEELQLLEHYEQERKNTQEKIDELEKTLRKLSTDLSKERKKKSLELAESIRSALSDLNFLEVDFSIEFTKLDHFTQKGFDEVKFMIATNPGETQKPLKEIASGGELSRIMLAIKTVMADLDDIECLIFDEIDTGISGRTAQRVSEKLSQISHHHQVICITHLPQIAAMADQHFSISKETKNGKTYTQIHLLKVEEIVGELARMLGGFEITPAVLKNAREMKELAVATKIY